MEMPSSHFCHHPLQTPTYYHRHHHHFPKGLSSLFLFLLLSTLLLSSSRVSVSATPFLCLGSNYTSDAAKLTITNATSVLIKDCVYGTQQMAILPDPTKLNRDDFLNGIYSITFDNTIFTAAAAALRIGFPTNFVMGFLNGTVRQIEIKIINCFIPQGVEFELSRFTDLSSYPPMNVLFQNNPKMGTVGVRGADAAAGRYANVETKLSRFNFTLAQTYVFACWVCAALSFNDLILLDHSSITLTDRSNFTGYQDGNSMIEVYRTQMHQQSTFLVTGYIHITMIINGRFLGPIIAFRAAHFRTGSTVMFRNGATIESYMRGILFAADCSVDEDDGSTSSTPSPVAPFHKSGVYFFGNESIGVFAAGGNGDTALLHGESPVLRVVEPCLRNISWDANSPLRDNKFQWQNGKYFISNGAYVITVNATIPRDSAQSSPNFWFKSAEEVVPAPTTPLLHAGPYIIRLLWSETTAMRYYNRTFLSTSSPPSLPGPVEEDPTKTTSAQSPLVIGFPPVRMFYSGLNILGGGSFDVKIVQDSTLTICPAINFTLTNSTIVGPLDLPDVTSTGSTIRVLNVRVGTSINGATFTYEAYPPSGTKAFFDKASLSRDGLVLLRNVTDLNYPERNNRNVFFSFGVPSLVVTQVRAVNMTLLIEECALGMFRLANVPKQSGAQKPIFDMSQFRIVRSEFICNYRHTTFILQSIVFIRSMISIVNTTANTLSDVENSQILSVSGLTLRDRSTFSIHNNLLTCTPSGRFHGPCLHFFSIALVNQSTVCITNNTVSGPEVGMQFNPSCVAAEPIKTSLETAADTNKQRLSGVYLEDNTFLVVEGWGRQGAIEMLATREAFTPTVAQQLRDGANDPQRANTTIHGFVQYWGPSSARSTGRFMWYVDRFIITSKESTQGTKLDTQHNAVYDSIAIPNSLHINGAWYLLVDANTLASLHHQQQQEGRPEEGDEKVADLPPPRMTIELENFLVAPNQQSIVNNGITIDVLGGNGAWNELFLGIPRDATPEEAIQRVSSLAETSSIEPPLWIVLRNTSSNNLWLKKLPSFTQVVVHNCSLGTLLMRSGSRRGEIPSLDVELLPNTSSVQLSVTQTVTNAADVNLRMAEGCVNTSFRFVQVRGMRLVLVLPQTNLAFPGVIEQLYWLVEDSNFDSRPGGALSCIDIYSRGHPTRRPVVIRQSHFAFLSLELYANTELDRGRAMDFAKNLTLESSSTIRTVSSTLYSNPIGFNFQCMVFPELYIAAGGGSMICFDDVLLRCPYAGFVFGKDPGSSGSTFPAAFLDSLLPPTPSSSSGEPRTSTFRIFRTRVVPILKNNNVLAVDAPDTLPIAFIAPANQTGTINTTSMIQDDSEAAVVAIQEGNCGVLPYTIERLRPDGAAATTAVGQGHTEDSFVHRWQRYKTQHQTWIRTAIRQDACAAEIEIPPTRTATHSPTHTRRIIVPRTRTWTLLETPPPTSFAPSSETGIETTNGPEAQQSTNPGATAINTSNTSTPSLPPRATTGAPFPEHSLTVVFDRNASRQNLSEALSRSSAKSLIDASRYQTAVSVGVPVSLLLVTGTSTLAGMGAVSSITSYARYSALLKIANCGDDEGDDDEAPSFLELPFQPPIALSSSDSEGRARTNGGVVMGTLLALVAAIIYLLVFRRMAGNAASSSSSGGGSSSSLLTRLLTVFGSACIAFFCPNCTGAATQALFGAPAVGVVVHLLCVLMDAAVTAVPLVAAALAPRFAAEKTRDDTVHHQQQQADNLKTTGASASTAEETAAFKGHLVNRSCCDTSTNNTKSDFVAAFSIFLDGCRIYPGTPFIRAVFGIEVAHASVVALVGSLPGTTLSACRVKASAVVVLCLLLLGYYLLVRPLRSKIEQIFASAVATLQAIFAGLILWMVLSLDSTTSEPPEWLATLASWELVIFLITLLLQPIVVAVHCGLRYYRKRRVQMNASTPRSRTPLHGGDKTSTEGEEMRDASASLLNAPLLVAAAMPSPKQTNVERSSGGGGSDEKALLIAAPRDAGPSHQGITRQANPLIVSNQ